MKRSLIGKFFLLMILLFPIIVFTSCSTVKNTKYFQDIPDSGKLMPIPKYEYTEPKIQSDDILTILVEPIDPTAAAAINGGNIPVANSAISITSASSGAGMPTSGYLVDNDGNVDVPILGKIKLSGYTINQAADTIKKIASKYYNSPSVIVRYANFKITVTGEVLRPGVYVMPNQKSTILDALSMAGDLTIYGKRDNVLLLREGPNNTKIAYRINLTKSNIISAPYYYLQQNDYIYIEPSKGKAAANDLAQTRYFAIFTSVLTIIIIVLSRINFK
jgi:polysaccharide export outer membrane protein